MSTVFFCASKACPGYSYPASNHPHPCGERPIKMPEKTLCELHAEFKKEKKAAKPKRSTKCYNYRFFEVAPDRFIKFSRLQKIIKRFPECAKIRVIGHTLVVHTEKARYDFKLLDAEQMKTFNRLYDLITA